MSEPTWKISLFGKMTIRTPAGENLSVQSRKCGELLAYLALRRNGHADRNAIVDAMWPDVDPFTGRARLKQVLARLRREVPGLPITANGKNEIELSLEEVEVDSHTMERRLKWLSALSLKRRHDAAHQILDMIGPGLLPELSQPWVQADRFRIQRIVRELQVEAGSVGAQANPCFRIGDELENAAGPIVGREQEVAEIREWLAGEDPRAAYIIGPPGVGKTKILAEALRECHDSCDAIVSLSTVQNVDAPWQDRLCEATGIRDPGQLTEGLIRLLKDFSRPILAIDDIDQADANVRDWTACLDRAIPRLRLLNTTRRQPMDGPVKLVEVQPLSSRPDADSAASDLLRQFAVQAGLSEGVIKEHAKEFWELADHLDGLPLALEVAAGWLPYMNPKSLLDRVKTGPGLVIQRAAVGRRSLVECMSPICHELPGPVREALVRLSVCRGGCGEALAESMLGPEWPWLIRSLCDRSLAQRGAGPSGSRFIVLQALRECVISLSTPEEAEKGFAAHTHACLELGAVATREINEGDRRRWLTWLRSEGDNLLAACERSLADREGAKRAFTTMSSLRAAFWLIGRPTELLRLSARACIDWEPSFAPITAETPWMIVENRLASLCKQGDLEDAIAQAIDYRLLAEACGDRNGASAALDFEGETRRLTGDYQGAFRAIEQAAKLKTALGLPRQALWLEAKLAKIETSLGRVENSNRRKERAFLRAGEIGDSNSEGMYAKEFAKVAMADGKWSKARQLADRSVAAFGRAGESSTRFDALLVLAAAMIGTGDSGLAIEAIEEAERERPFADEGQLLYLTFLRDAAQREYSSLVAQEVSEMTGRFS
jgi:tetratricopeptide (TPR) repeat protein